MAACAAQAAEVPGVLYNNDAVNIRVCPPLSAGDAGVKASLESSVDEAPVGVQLLQPGNGWVPWWQSSVYSPVGHYEWFARTTGLAPDEIGAYVQGGGDLVADFVAHCRTRGISPMVSLRMNDYHGSESWDILVRAWFRGNRAGRLRYLWGLWRRRAARYWNGTRGSCFPTLRNIWR